jgi:hypothetical protein
VPTLVVRIPLPLVMSPMGLVVFPAAIVRTAITSMLCFDGTERQKRANYKGCDSQELHYAAPQLSE